MTKEVDKGGRPLKFKTVKELKEKIIEYFEVCLNTQEVPTITGLALDLDTTRDTLIDYQNRDKFSYTVKKAKLFIHNYAEQELFRTSGNVTGIIFNLKNNWGWKDKTEHEIGGLDGGAFKMDVSIDSAIDKAYKKENEDKNKK